MSATQHPESSNAVAFNIDYGTQADYQNAVKELADVLPGLTSTEQAVLEDHGKSFGDTEAGKPRCRLTY